MTPLVEQATLVAKAEEATRAFGSRPICFSMSLLEVTALLGAVKLALRHPVFAATPTAHWLRQFVATAIAQLPPDIAALLQTDDDEVLS